MALTALQTEIATSCGTIIVNKERQILLCHVTGTRHWDIPKGIQEPGESTFEAAKRELREETSLAFVDDLFEEIGGFAYQKNKRLHLYRVRAPDSLCSLAHLRCTSHFTHHVTGQPTLEMDDFCWASRAEIRRLCTLPMAERLLSLD